MGCGVLGGACWEGRGFGGDPAPCWEPSSRSCTLEDLAMEGMRLSKRRFLKGDAGG